MASKNKPLPGEKMVSGNLRIIRKHLLNIDCDTVGNFVGLSSKTIQMYERSSGKLIPSLICAKKLCDLYGTKIGDLCTADYEFFWCGSPELESIQLNCLRRFGDIDTEKYEKETLEALESHHFPCAEYFVRQVIQDTLRCAIKDACERHPEEILKDPSICVNVSSNLDRLIKLCSVSMSKITFVTGLSPNLVSSALKAGDMSLSVVIKFADFFGVKVGELVKKNPDFGDKQIIAGNVAIGPEYKHPIRCVLGETVREHNRQIDNVLSEDDAHSLITKTFAFYRETIEPGGIECQKRKNF